MRIFLGRTSGMAPHFSPADMARGNRTNGRILEHVTFRVKPELTEAMFLAAAMATEAIVAAQPGFVRRRLLCGPDGLWSDLVEWNTLAAATTAAEAILVDPSFAPFGGAIVGASVTMLHLPILWSMGD